MKCDKLIYKRLDHKNADGKIIEVYPRRDVDIAIYELKNLIEDAGIHNTNLEREVNKYKRAFSLENKEKRTLEKQLRKQKIIFFEMLSYYALWKAEALWRMRLPAVMEKAERKERQAKLFRQIADKLKEKKS